jgi:hypothetical protein
MNICADLEYLIPKQINPYLFVQEENHNKGHDYERNCHNAIYHLRWSPQMGSACLTAS